MLARRAAVVDAQRNLLESVKGVAVDSETTVENFMLKSDIIHTKVNGIITGARVVSEEMQPDGVYKVTMAVPVYGVGSVSDVAINAVVGESAPVPVPVPIVVFSCSFSFSLWCNGAQRRKTEVSPSRGIHCVMWARGMARRCYGNRRTGLSRFLFSGLRALPHDITPIVYYSFILAGFVSFIHNILYLGT